MSSWHGAVVVPALLTFCTDSLWSPEHRADMHARCHGYGLIKLHSPSGSEPWIYGLCTCACHTAKRANELQDNLDRWEWLAAHRAPLNRSPDRWMNQKQ
jgi:hypothetical protein